MAGHLHARPIVNRFWCRRLLLGHLVRFGRMFVGLATVIVGELRVSFGFFLVATLMMHGSLMMMCGSKGVMFRCLHMVLGRRVLVLGFLLHCLLTSNNFIEL